MMKLGWALMALEPHPLGVVSNDANVTLSSAFTVHALGFIPPVDVSRSFDRNGLILRSKRYLAASRDNAEVQPSRADDSLEKHETNVKRRRLLNNFESWSARWTIWGISKEDASGISIHASA